jgi:hypothetical protein
MLEPLEDRTLPSVSLLFDLVAGKLSLLGDATASTVRESVSRTGFVEVAVDGQRHSGNPASAFFDPALATATAGTLAGIRFDGGGQDTLILGTQQLAGSLAVSGDAAVVADGVGVARRLSIQAPSIDVTGHVDAGDIALSAPGLVTVEASGRLVAGRIEVSVGVFVNSGQLDADGAAGGQIVVSAGNVLNGGHISADGSGPGGTVRAAFSGSYVDTAAAVTSADGGAGPGGEVVLDGGGGGHLFNSGRHDATGAVGGRVDLFGREVELVAASVDASGEWGGGTVRVGGDFHGGTVGSVNAQTVMVTAATVLRADGRTLGDGGRVAVWADGDTTFGGAVSARGGATGGDGGFVEVSGAGSLDYGGTADTGAPAGKAGTLLLDPKNLVIDAVAGVFPQFSFVDPHPTSGATFGQGVTVLSTGNVVVTNPSDNFGASYAGAVYLYDGLTGALLSSLVGSSASDFIGTAGVTALSNGNYVVGSQHWNGSLGAVTWGSGTAGVTGAVSAANSLVGSGANDFAGLFVTALSNGNYVVASAYGGRGAVTWGSGTTGVTGAVSAANSLVGSSANDGVGNGGIVALSNGNYVVRSRPWNFNRGAVTWGSGTAGVTGAVSAANSLVGSSRDDSVGNGGVTALSNGNYVVASGNWNGNLGAATWGRGTAGVTGAVSAANSLVGSSPNDYVGYYGVTALSNGNYVVASPFWNSTRGAATWGDGTAGVTGAVSAANSLVGSSAGDYVGLSGVTALSNGNYVVRSQNWNATRGAATWGDGTAGVTGVVSAANSLVGSSPNDSVGYGGVTALSNGNYVVSSYGWNGGLGAATWGSGTAGVTGTVSAANSLVGSSANDLVGVFVTALSNGNYVVDSPHWNGNRGAATWGSGTAGVTGVVSAANSLVGSSANDSVGNDGVTALSNGNYVVASSPWNGGLGAATWGSGTAGVTGAVSAANSLVGSNAGDAVGLFVTSLSNGNYVVDSPHWNGNRGAATWGSGSAGVSGIISNVNSLVGSNASDYVGAFFFSDDSGDHVTELVTALSNGNYVILSPLWNGARGAATWGSGTAGVTGTVSAANSLVGSSAGDYVGIIPGGSSGVTALSNGNYVVASPSWNGGRGAATWASGLSGQTLDGASVITPQNSVVGLAANSNSVSVVEDPSHQAFVTSFPYDGSGRVVSGFADPNQLTFARGQSQTVTITPALLTATLNTGGTVVLQASNDITINSPITVSAGGNGGALKLQAGRSILINASITTDNGALTLIANDQLAKGFVDSQRDPGAAVITMATGTALNTGTGALAVTLSDAAGKSNNASGALTLKTITARSIAVSNNGPSAGSDVVLGVVTTTGAQSYSSPNGVIRVMGNLTASNKPITFNNSVMLSTGLTLSAGNSTVTFAGGTVAPDPGVLTIAGGCTFSSSSTFKATLNGTGSSSYSQVTASGPVNLGGSTLMLALGLGFTPQVGDSFTLLTTSNPSGIKGTFAGLAEGAIFTQGGVTFQITYQGGPNGKSVVITRVA